MKKKVLVTYNMFRSGYAELVEKYDVTFPPDGAESFTYEEVLRMIPEYDALQSMFNFPVDKQLMDAGVKSLPQIRLWDCCWLSVDVFRSWTGVFE